VSPVEHSPRASPPKRRMGADVAVHDGRGCTRRGDMGVRNFEPGFRDRGAMSFNRRRDRWSTFDRRGDRPSSFDRGGDRGMSLGVGPGLLLSRMISAPRVGTGGLPDSSACLCATAGACSLRGPAARLRRAHGRGCGEDGGASKEPSVIIATPIRAAAPITAASNTTVMSRQLSRRT
jgi:hypothetical protein